MWKLLEKLGSGSSQRRSRFIIHIPISYRRVGDFAWSQAKSENLSRSGVLFRAAKPLEVNCPVEMQFVAPPELGDGGNLVACRGYIVRLSDINPQEHRLSMAAHFKHYQVIQRPGQW